MVGVLPAWAVAMPADPPPDTLPEIVVTATRRPVSAFDLPVSISSVDLDRPGLDTPGVNASEYLGRIPGVLVRDRQNHAQDEQISIRGAGARSTFGVRGVRLYVDGIPATMPDGQGQVSHFDFASADRIEVMRGPFSALYGNSSGGVIQIFTADGTEPSALRGGIHAGSDGARRVGVGARGRQGDIGYNLDLSHFRSDGFRRHSHTERINGNAKFDLETDAGGKLTLLLNTLSLPQAEDPKGLTKRQFHDDPRQANQMAWLYDTRKSVHQTQGGVSFEQPLAEHQSVRAMLYYGRRGTEQFLSVPVAAQVSPLSQGGMIDLDTFYKGVDLRWSYKGLLAGRALDLTAGVAHDRENQRRRGYENFDGDKLGVRGRLRRNQQDDVYNIDEYVQASWQYAERWSLDLGIRHSEVRFRSRDHYITGSNPDDSGRVTYHATTPVAGLMFRASRHWHLYASWGRGFETPTFSELAYRDDGAGGLNLALHPSRSSNMEVGSKWRLGGATWNVALFRADTGHDIGVRASAGGRSIYQNTGRSRRQGAELGLQLPLSSHWLLGAAYTWLDAHYRDAFGDCTGPAGCRIQAGADIPGVPRHLLHARLGWHGPAGWHAAMQLDAVSAVNADDAGRAVAPGYASLGLSAGRVLNTSRYRIEPYVRIDNLLDHAYIGSVIVNQANGGSFEPAPGRSFWLGVEVRLRAAR